MSSISLPGAVQRVLDAINAADTDAFVAGFAEDGYVDDWGRVLRGHDGVRQWAGSDAIGAGARIEVLEASSEPGADGEVTEIQFTWSSRVFNGQSSAFVTVVDDLVTSFRIPPHA